MLEQHADDGQECGGKKSPHKDTSATACLHTSSGDFLGFCSDDVVHPDDHEHRGQLGMEPMQVHVVRRVHQKAGAPEEKTREKRGDCGPHVEVSRKNGGR